MNYTLKIPLSLCIVLLLSLYGCGERLELKDRPAPDFTLTLLNGAEAPLGELRGSPVILYFFASW